MTTSPRKAILVGLGSFSRTWYRTCEEHPAIDLVAFVARSEGTRSRFADEFSIDSQSMYASLPKAIAECDADCVIDVTPPGTHKEIALVALDAGMDLIQEKPMCDDLADAEKVAAISADSGVVHMVSQNYRFGHLPRKTRSLLEEGVIGVPEQLVVNFAVPWADSPGTHYVTEPYMFLTDMGVHHFDMLRYVLKETPSQVYVDSWNPSWGWHAGDASHVAIFDYASGLKAIHVATGCSLGSKTTWNGSWRIEGSEGVLRWEDDRIYVSLEHRTDTPHTDEIALDQGVATGISAVIDEFVAAVTESREPECSARDNLESLRMVFAAVESARSGERVRIDAGTG